MAINKKKLKNIKKDAEKLKEKFDNAEEGEKFAKEHEQLLIDLNTAIDDRIDQFRSDSIRILRDVHQPRPYQIFSVINEQTDRIRKVTDAISLALDPVTDNFFRKASADCLKDIVDICSRHVAEKWTKIKIQAAGGKLN